MLDCWFIDDEWWMKGGWMMDERYMDYELMVSDGESIMDG
jgi:hypothetical protein